MRSALRTTPALAALLLVLTGCGDSAYETDERTISVESGEKFTLEVPADPELGQNWYLASPAADPDVLKYRGDREDTGEGDGTQFFDFTALSPGKATVKLLFCPYGRCHSAEEAASKPVPTATGTPKDSDQEAAYYLYTITVR
ncbi:protease inhibitor I42 family protein [Streptomyces sp. NBC_01619]|uniref:Uncharacterized protein n=1 Tax=Streptomyces pratisoli TaxID=3139917 RepID=A0ACC6QLH0_9ACTN|nr:MULTISPECIES: hypothetical protein [unclassified Streptomyces]MCX4512600.1 protease inhibitor I42 family protein [Streptomyces sp. NBC_01619]